ncbi:hypothetical protein GYH30_040101 [Glycine max]|nr:hypothetical protein GYH30_040101 [Glycine max]
MLFLCLAMSVLDLVYNHCLYFIPNPLRIVFVGHIV